MGKRLAVFLNSFPLLQSFFWVKNAKNRLFFKEKMVLRVVYIKLKFRWLQTGLSDWKKHQTIEILLMVEYLRIFLKCCIFQNFSRFLKFTSIPWSNCWIHLILFEHCRPNTVELD